MKFPKSYLRILSLRNLLSLLTTTALLSPTAFAAEVTLAWDPSPDAGVAGYRLHYGTASGIYTGYTNAGAATTLTVRGLLDGTTYYFSATAVGTNQLESDFSNEIVYSVPAANTTITVIGGQTINEDGVAGPIGFTVGDGESAAGSLTLSAASSNAGLVPVSNIVFGGSGASRTVSLTPVANASGSAQITVTVSDGELSATRQFVLTVNSVNDVPTVTSISNQSIAEDGATSALGFTVGDVETAAGSLIVSAASSNPGLVPEANISFGGSGANRTVTVRPAADQSGGAQITISVSDGTDAVTSAFSLTVTAVNDAPTITVIGNQTIDEDTVAGPISFTVGDVESAAGTLTLSGDSSNLTLVPKANIVFGGSGANRAVTVTPAANQFGAAQITVTVSDGALTAQRTFTLTVNSV
ncbi:MAG: Ig-like domain-containing protein, partial [Verrucomicrobia bacterium]|nr:Ig-like domain-containing protein [Verrucomicrobiota bacterium]